MASGRSMLLVAILALAAVAATSGRTLQTVENVKPVKDVKKEAKEMLHPKDIAYGALNTTEQLCVNKVMGWYKIKTLHPYMQCGGAGGNCSAFGSQLTHCHDAAFFDYKCPKGFTCQKQSSNKFYWQCLPKEGHEGEHKGEHKHEPAKKPEEHKHEPAKKPEEHKHKPVKKPTPPKKLEEHKHKPAKKPTPKKHEEHKHEPAKKPTPPKKEGDILPKPEKPTPPNQEADKPMKFKSATDKDVKGNKEGEKKKQKTDLKWLELSKEQQVDISECFGWLLEGKKRVLKPYSMCGGSAPHMCALFGKGKEHCKDEAFHDWECPEGFKCTRQSEYWWQCDSKTN